MKINTITCHNVYNYGASLQAFALSDYLSKQGHDVKIIDYMPSYIRRNLGLWAIGKKWDRNLFYRFAFYCYVVPIRLLQKRTRKKFHSYNKKFLHLTKRYNSFDELIADPPVADVYFCGSDQIWNPQIENGLDPAFYIEFAPASSIRASYAASFSVSKLADEYKSFIKMELQKMDYISVREKTGVAIINDLGVEKKVVNVMDPVFLIEPKQWKSMTYVPKYTNYILVYDQENSKAIRDIALYMSRKMNKQVIAFKDLYPRRYADVQIKYADPIDFISFIANADLVITNSFHCSAFSILFEKEFFVIPRAHQKVNSRMSDLLQRLNIKGHMVSDIESLKDAVSIDYTEVRKLLELPKNISKDYIEEVLDSFKKTK